MTTDRWSQFPDGVIHPEAVKIARALESKGYTQHDRGDLHDGEGVIAVAAHDGSHAPARYFRRYKPIGDVGVRPDHVVESWPDSPFTEHLELDHANQEVEPGKWISKVGLFRLNSPQHLDDVAMLYDERARRHRDEAVAST